MSDEIDYSDIPAIEVSQWRVGRVLSEDDILLLHRLLREYDEEAADSIELFHNARRQVLHEIGGDDLVAASEKAYFALSQVALKRAFASYAEKAAKLDQHNN